MDISAVMIILNYNDGKTAAALADSIKEYACLSQVIVVDNCSFDDSYSYMNQKFSKSSDDSVSSKITVLRTPENKGYATGNNYGIRYAITHFAPDYIFVANPDIKVEEQALQSILTAMQQNPAYGVMSCLVNQGYNVWNLPGFAGVLESLFLIWFNLDKRCIKKKLASSSHSLETVGVVEGSFFCISSSAYQAVNGLDERTFLYSEEIILSKRLQKAKLSVGVLTKVHYDHFHSVSIKKEYHSSKAKAFHHFYQSFKIYNKHYLHTSVLQDSMFAVAYALAYLERILYDFIMLLKRH